MMLFGKRAVEMTRRLLENIQFINAARRKVTYFTRKRKISLVGVVCFNLNKRGLTLKMENRDFAELCGMEKYTSSAMLNQRKKLDPEIFRAMNTEVIAEFYSQYREEVKTLNGYVLLGVDGSDAEVPNTPAARETFGSVGHEDKQVARCKLSNAFDLLNEFIIDTEVETYKFSERELFKKHLKNAGKIIRDFPIIWVCDRGYHSLSLFYKLIKAKASFVIRVPKHTYKAEQDKMSGQDEWVTVEHDVDRMRHYKEDDPGLYNYYEGGNTISLRLVKFILPSGETELLATNLAEDVFGTEKILEIYRRRWGSETNYHYLKESMKVTNISSSIEVLVKQEIYSQMFVFNLMQAMANDEAKKISQESYKHEMKVNINMAIGSVKRKLILILLEDDAQRRSEIFNQLTEEIREHLVPIRRNRQYKRAPSGTNEYHINKRKSF